MKTSMIHLEESKDLSFKPVLDEKGNIINKYIQVSCIVLLLLYSLTLCIFIIAQDSSNKAKMKIVDNLPVALRQLLLPRFLDFFSIFQLFFSLVFIFIEKPVLPLRLVFK
jgi:hypothetical protein